MPKKNYNLSTHDMEHEVVEHIILEKKGLLKGHHNHFLPKKKVKKERKKLSKKDIRFFLVGYAMIGVELWLLYYGLKYYSPF